ncbi:MAG: RING finger domain-containing protein [Candidatus Hodarchaeota archaeon]
MKTPRLVAKQIKKEQENSQTLIYWPSISRYMTSQNSFSGTISPQLVPKIIAEWKFTKAARCMICWAGIKEGQNIETCPHCGGKAHSEHLTKWLASRPLSSRICPNCRSPLKY